MQELATTWSFDKKQYKTTFTEQDVMKTKEMYLRIKSVLNYDKIGYRTKEALLVQNMRTYEEYWIYPEDNTYMNENSLT